MIDVRAVFVLSAFTLEIALNGEERSDLPVDMTGNVLLEVGLPQFSSQTVLKTRLKYNAHCVIDVLRGRTGVENSTQCLPVLWFDKS